jgi:hypothetical protein
LPGNRGASLLVAVAAGSAFTTGASGYDGETAHTTSATGTTSTTSTTGTTGTTTSAARTALETSIIDILSVALAAIFAGWRLRIGASSFLAFGQKRSRLSVASVFGATLVETLHLVLLGFGLTGLLAGRRRARADAFEEAVDRTTEARFAVTAVIHTRIEDGQRRHHARITTFACRHAVAIRRVFENRLELGAVGAGSGSAAL